MIKKRATLFKGTPIQRKRDRVAFVGCAFSCGVWSP